jgi:CBS domain-containing protein
MQDMATHDEGPLARRLGLLGGGSDLAPGRLNLPLARLGTRAPVTCEPGTPIRTVLETMQREAVGAMVIVTPDGRPLGVFTLRDVLAKIALPQRNVDVPVASVMDRRLFTLPEQAQGFEAAMLMAREGVRHVLVVDGERLTGVVSESRLFAAWRGGFGELAAAIRGAETVDAVVTAAAGIRGLVEPLLEEHVPADSVTVVVTTFNDLVTGRLIELAGLTSVLERVGGCWIALGSQGRREQTLATDQDNAIVFADDADTDATRRAVLPLARRVNEALDRCGFPLCRGEVMASNPRCCLSLREWRERFASWIDRPDPQALLNATIFFDFRPIHGERSASDDLRGWLSSYAEDRGRFLFPMAQNALANRPPLGLFRDFVLTDGDGYPDTLDLKVSGVQLFVVTARIYSLADGVAATNTLERLAATAGVRGIPAQEAEAWTAAFRFIQLLRLRHNAAQRARGDPVHNRLDPATLNELERRMLKEALRQARSLQSRLTRDFSLTGATFGA